ncbi:MAG TPA: type 1 glutamine amidotransferase domain-containing protein [Acidimicrobiales bacterium]|nr:type 1 glutamine amidotransferase domain-containing protein [Acidimicrobiales bacterium]
MANVLLPIPSRDFDPTEVAVSWRVLTARGHHVTFASPDGRPGSADDLMVTGRGLPFFGRLLRANADARRDYAALQHSPSFLSPLSWSELEGAAYDGLLLPGGHRARGMIEYLESPQIQQVVLASFTADKPIGAICHGVLVAARSISPVTGRSVLHGRQTTALTWQLEKTAWAIGRRIRFWDPNYYRTYMEEAGQPSGYMSVQQEVTRALAQPGDFLDVPPDAPDYRRKTGGRARDSNDDGGPAWVVRDGNYLSARWPGDAHTFARTLASMLDGS